MFARPLDVIRENGRGMVKRSELWIWDEGSSSPGHLGTLGARSPMEPEVDPGGAFVLYADWFDGAIYKVPLVEPGSIP